MTAQPAGSRWTSALAVGRRPEPASLSRFLSSAPLVRDDGAVMSWVSEDGTAYPYPEAAAVWLSAHALSLLSSDRAGLVARRLAGHAVVDGAVGRDRALYVFDSSLALAALLRHWSTGDSFAALLPACQALREFIVEGLESGHGVSPAKERSHHWSRAFGTHLLKTVFGLVAHERLLGQPLAPSTREALLRLAGTFHPRPEEETYLHAWCYSLEGLWAMSDLGFVDADEIIDESLLWLAEQQLSCGGLPAFAHQPGEPRADVTAQAARLWLLRDSGAFNRHIELAMALLASLQGSTGGIHYAPGTPHSNCWATLFALQSVNLMDCVAAADRGAATVLRDLL